MNGAKIANYSYPVYIATAEGVTLGIGYRRRVRKKLELWGYQMVGKKIKIGLTV